VSDQQVAGSVYRFRGGVGMAASHWKESFGSPPLSRVSPESLEPGLRTWLENLALGRSAGT
jgi:hypothetical protein